MPKKIKIEGQSKSFDYELIKDSVVSIGNKYYLRTSDLIVRIENSDGERRYYRKVSPLIFKDFRGNWYLKSEGVELWDGSMAFRNDYSLVKMWNGKFGIQGEGVLLCYADHKYYEMDNIEVVDLSIPYHTRGQKMTKAHRLDVRVLDSDFYGESCTAHINSGIGECEIRKTYFKASDLESYHKPNGNQIRINAFDLPKMNLKPVATGPYQGSNYIDFNFEVFNLDKEISKTKDIVYSEELGFLCLNNDVKKACEETYNRIKDQNATATRALKSNITEDKRALSKLDFVDGENYPKSVHLVHGDINGSSVYFEPASVFTRKHFSQTLSQTGGKGYTFGIEHESCAGIVPEVILCEHGLRKIGDGSTRYLSSSRRLRHYEYVTSVLHGDIGINNMYEYLSKIQKYILQNDKCSTHIHIGGQHSNNLSTDEPKFNRRFSAYAIKLGAQVEDSLAALMPESRNPNRKISEGEKNYSASIKAFGKYPIKTKKDIDRLISSYVFNKSALDRRNNSETMLGRWTHGRYKWLNLVNCNSNNGNRRGKGFKTIEFRIFPPTTNPEKVHFWVLICQAFVWFVENKQREIEKGKVTIQDVLREAYHDKPIYEFVLENLEKQ